MNKVSIILVDWIEYPLHRDKKLGHLSENTIACGLGAILDNMEKYAAGIDYEVTLIVTGVNHPFYEWCVKYYRALRHLLFPKKFSSDRINFFQEKIAVYHALAKQHPFIKQLVFKDNTGQDIGAYNLSYQMLKQAGCQGDVVFMNSSLEGPNEDNWLAKYCQLFAKDNSVGLCGITINPTTSNLTETNLFAPHVQSFFLYSNMTVLQQVFPENLPGYNSQSGRVDLVMSGEIGISTAMLDAGFGITSLAFPDYVYKKGDVWELPLEQIRFKKEFRQFANRI